MELWNKLMDYYQYIRVIVMCVVISYKDLFVWNVYQVYIGGFTRDSYYGLYPGFSVVALVLPYLMIGFTVCCPGFHVKHQMAKH